MQAIKKEDGDAGIVHFGTEVVTTEDKSVSALLGASPGASVCVHIVLEVIQKCFPEEMKKKKTKGRIEEMIPVYGKNISSLKSEDDIQRYKKWNDSAESILGLK